MIKERSIGHDVEDYQKADFLIPKTLGEEYKIVDTVWSNKKKKGDTMITTMPTKSIWDLKDGEVVEKHTSKKRAILFHNKIVKKMKEELYGSADTPCVNPKKD